MIFFGFFKWYVALADLVPCSPLLHPLPWLPGVVGLGPVWVFALAGFWCSHFVVFCVLGKRQTLGHLPILMRSLPSVLSIHQVFVTKHSISVLTCPMGIFGLFLKLTSLGRMSPDFVLACVHPGLLTNIVSLISPP